MNQRVKNMENSWNHPMVLDPMGLQWQFIIMTVLLAIEAAGEEDWGRRSKNLKWIAVLVSFLWVWDKTATVRCVLNCECMWFKEKDRERQGEGERQREGERESAEWSKPSLSSWLP